MGEGVKRGEGEKEGLLVLFILALLRHPQREVEFLKELVFVLLLLVLFVLVLNHSPSPFPSALSLFGKRRIISDPNAKDKQQIIAEPFCSYPLNHAIRGEIII